MRRDSNAASPQKESRSTGQLLRPSNVGALLCGAILVFHCNKESRPKGPLLQRNFRARSVATRRDSKVRLPLLPPFRRNPHTQSIQANEACRIGLIVGALVVFKRGDARIKQAIAFRGAAYH